MLNASLRPTQDQNLTFAKYLNLKILPKKKRQKILRHTNFKNCKYALVKNFNIVLH